MTFKSLMVKGPELCGIEKVHAERIGEAGGAMFDLEIGNNQSAFRRQDVDKTDIEVRFWAYFVMLDAGIQLGGDAKKVQGLKKLLMLGGAKTEDQVNQIQEDPRYLEDNVETAVFAEALEIEEGQEVNASIKSFWI